MTAYKPLFRAIKPHPEREFNFLVLFPAEAKSMYSHSHAGGILVYPRPTDHAVTPLRINPSMHFAEPTTSDVLLIQLAYYPYTI